MLYSRILTGVVILGLLLAGIQPVAAAADDTSSTPNRVEVVPAQAPEAVPQLTAPYISERSKRTSFPDFTSEAPTGGLDLPAGTLEGFHELTPLDDAKNLGVRPTLVGAPNGLTGTVEYEYTVCALSGSASSNSCGSGVPAVAYSGWISGSFTVPAGKLAANTTYKWIVSARNNGWYSGDPFVNHERWFSTGSTLAAPGTGDFQTKPVSPTSQAVLATLTPTLVGGLRHAANQQYEYRFTVYLRGGTAGNSLVADSGWITTASWTIPSGALTWSSAYTWSMSARNNPYLATLFDPTRSFGTAVALPAGSAIGKDSQVPRVLGVSLSDRHFEHGAVDAALPSVGESLAIERGYSSSVARVGAFGLGWSSILDMAVTDTTAAKIIRLADGHEIAFGKDPNGAFIPTPGTAAFKLVGCSSPCSLRLTEASGQIVQFNTNDLASVTTPDGYVTTFSRASDGKITTITDVASGRSLGVTWSGSKVSTVTQNGAPAGTPAKWTYTYSGDLLTSACRPASTPTCTKYGYTSSPQKLSTVTGPTGAVTTRVVYSGASATSVSTPEGTSSFTSSTVNNAQQVAVTNGSGATDTYVVDAAGRVVKLTNSRGGVELWKYDKFGRTAAYKSAQDSYIQLAYNANGAVTERTIGRAFTDSREIWTPAERYQYYTDGAAAGKLRIATKPYSQLYITTAPTLDELRAQAATEYEYDASGKISALIGGTSAGPRITTRYAYTTGGEAAVGGGTTPKGLLKTSTDAAGKVTSFVYTKAGELASSTDPRGAKTSYSYDWAGRLTSKTVAGPNVASQITTYTYDAAGMLETITEPAATDAVSGDKHQLRTKYTRNLAGYVTSVTQTDLLGDAERVTTYTLDGFGRALTEVGPDSSVRQTSQYDQFGRLVRVTDADGHATRLDYTAQGDLAKRVAIGAVDGGPTAQEIVLEQNTYDSAGRLATQINRSGVERSITYFEDNKLLSVTAKVPQPDGTTRSVREELNGYNSAGDLEATEQRGATTAIGYDNARRPVSITTSTGSNYLDEGAKIRQITRSFDPRGLVTAETVTATSSLRSTAYQYDDAGDVIRVQVGATPNDPDAAVTTYSRDALGRITSTIDARSTTSDPIEQKVAWDTLNRSTRVTTHTNGSDRVVATGFDAFGNVTSVQRPSGAVTTSSYDNYDRETAALDWHQPGEVSTPRTWEYTSSGRVAAYTAADGVSTYYDYDQWGQNTTVTRSRAHEPDRVTEFGYDRFGNQVSETDPSGATSLSTYDALGRVIEQRTPVGDKVAISKFTYDDRGNLTRSVSPEGRVTTATFNTLDELISTVSVDGTELTLARDAAGRVVKQKRSDGTTTWINYDARDNPTRTTILDTATSTPIRSRNMAYDAGGLLTRQVDPLGGVRSFGYDADGLLDEVVYEDGATARIGYDQDGNATSYTDPNDATTEYAYAANGLVTSVAEPEVPGATSATDRTWTWQYDGSGRPVHESRPGGGESAFTYDLDGNLASEHAVSADGDATRTFGYDLNGRLIRAQHPDGVQSFGYDELGRLVSADGPAGTAQFDYDLDGNLLERSDDAGTASFTYDAESRLAAMTSTDGTQYTYAYTGSRLTSIAQPAQWTTENFDYDRLGNLTSQRFSAGGNVLLSDTYAYDAAGNRTALTSTRNGNEETEYSYDIRNRLVGWKDSAEEHTLQWDAAGNLTNSDNEEREYNARNQLTSVNGAPLSYSPDGRRLSASGVSYEYDAFGQLASAGANQFTYDGLGRLASDGSTLLKYAGLDRDPSTIGESHFARDTNGRPIAADGNRVFTDVRGDLIGSFDAASGTVAGRVYDPFGSAESAGPLGYQGDYMAAGLVNMDARWYDPATATFVSRDDVTVPLDQENRYAYAGGNPLSYHDPSGHWYVLPIIGIAALEAAANALGWTALAGMLGGTLGYFGLTSATAYLENLDRIANISVDVPRVNVGSLTASRANVNSVSSIHASNVNIGSFNIPRIGSLNIPRIGSLNIPTLGPLNIPTLGPLNIPTIGPINVPEIGPIFTDSELASFYEAMPRFGIDKPSWAYPEPFLAPNAAVLPGAGSWQPAVLCPGSSSCGGVGAGTSCAAIGGAFAGVCAPPGLVTALGAVTPAAGAAAAAAALEISTPATPPQNDEPERDERCEPEDEDGQRRPPVEVRREFDNKIRSQYWKREAITNAGNYSADELAGMRRHGVPPTGIDGHPMEVHHLRPISQGGSNHPSNLQGMTRTEHRLGPNYKINHPRLDGC